MIASRSFFLLFCNCSQHLLIYGFLFVINSLGLIVISTRVLCYSAMDFGGGVVFLAMHKVPGEGSFVGCVKTNGRSNIICSNSNMMILS